MEKILWILLVFMIIQLQNAASQDSLAYAGWRIDCGGDVPLVDPNMTVWDIDEDFTQSGINKRTLDQQPLDEMNTLRVFPDRTDQNCYAFPTTMFLQKTLRYVIRAGFSYGNYDGLSNPPTFDLHLNGGKWSTVNTTPKSGPIYHEIVYSTQESAILTVCLVQTRDGEVPFISTLEFTPLPDVLYPHLNPNVSFTLVSRTNLGGGEIRYAGLFTDEFYNRIWTRGVTPLNCIQVTTLQDSNVLGVENDPPVPVLEESIVSNTSDPINLTFELPTTTPQSAHFVFYFTELANRPMLNDTRIIDININGQMMQTVETEVNKCKVVTLYPVVVSGPTINITVAANKSSTLPPIIAAMEVFTKNDLEPIQKNTNANAQEHLSVSHFVLISVLCLLVSFIA
ncbi:unnamed protein product [Dovyalis caffra]|uniref:Malectin-like domain-containing protein n=1 Tax=Dovyalis caffra TaxID=77055 RepID=A0AAV1QVV6_9ROSI|nr:unnamed protein product [Dovyalis caffra]